MAQLGLIEYVKRNILEWDDSIMPMKETGYFLSKPNLTNQKMKKVAMNIKEKVPTKKPTEIIFKILDITYKISNNEKFTSSATNLKIKEINCYKGYSMNLMTYLMSH